MQTLRSILSIALLSYQVLAYSNNITSVAGKGGGDSTYNGDNILGTDAVIYHPSSVDLDAYGNMYICESGNNRIRKVALSSGIITTIAGTSLTPAYNGDRITATSASLNVPTGVAVDLFNNIYVADNGNKVVRKIAKNTNMIMTVAGGGNDTLDGCPAVMAKLGSAYSISFDMANNMYIVDIAEHCIRRVDSITNIITTAAGICGTSGYNSDGLNATSTLLNSPTSIDFDSFGNWYILDSGNNRIRKMSISSELVSTIAGTGSAGFIGDGGLAINALIQTAGSLTLDVAGNVYFSDSTNNVIRRIDAVSGNITSVAGGGAPSVANYGDGDVDTSASLSDPRGLVFDFRGNLYIADYNNNLIRMVETLGNNHYSWRHIHWY